MCACARVVFLLLFYSLPTTIALPQHSRSHSKVLLYLSLITHSQFSSARTHSASVFIYRLLLASLHCTRYTFFFLFFLHRLCTCCICCNCFIYFFPFPFFIHSFPFVLLSGYICCFSSFSPKHTTPRVPLFLSLSLSLSLSLLLSCFLSRTPAPPRGFHDYFPLTFDFLLSETSTRKTIFTLR